MAETMTVYYATNRNETGTEKKPAFGDTFHEKGPHYLRFGSAEVATPGEEGGDYAIKSIYLAPETLPDDADPRARPVLGSREIFEELRLALKDSEGDLLILLHGFASDFLEALQRAAELRHRYAAAERPLFVLVFSWPADGTMVPYLSYYSDRDDARGSADAIARLFLKALDYFKDIGPRRFCRRPLHLVAHSMGNYALRHAFQAILRKYVDGALPRLFRNIFLMAADEDNDTLELQHKMARLPELAEAVHVYYSPSDRALAISDLTKGNPDRLGSTGPRTLTNLPHKITLVDCRNVDDTGPIADARHQYYRKRAEVVADVRQVLAGVAPDEIAGRVYIPEKLSYRIAAAG